MNTLKFTLPESNNSEYYNIINVSNEIIVRRNDINKRLLAIDTKKMWNSRKAKKVLSVIQPEVERFVEDALKWKHNTSNFILKPHFVFPDNDNLSLVFQHFIDNLRDAVQRIERSISLIENNYNLVAMFIEGQINFRLAF